MRMIGENQSTTLPRYLISFPLPPTTGNDSRIVNLTVGIRSISDISEMESSLTIQYLMGLEWYDERLKFKPFMENNKLKNYITLNGNVLKEKGI